MRTTFMLSVMTAGAIIVSAAAVPHNAAGHEGDLPVLVVDQNGSASLPVVAKRLKVKDVLGRAIMIHAGGDNFDDVPAPLGGGGGRIACGVVR